MPAEQPSGEAVRVAGVVREVSAPPPTAWTARVAGATHKVRNGGFAVVEVDGVAVRVVTDDAELVGAPSAVERGGWRDANSRALHMFAADLAPPFEEAELTGIVLAAGDEVEIYGEVLERGFAPDAGEGDYREAPATSLRRIRGLIVARGDDARGELDRAIARLYPPARRAARRPKGPDPRRGDPGSPLNRPPLASAALLFVYLGFIGFAALIGGGWPKGALAPLALGAAAIVVVSRPERTDRDFRHGDGKKGEERLGVAMSRLGAPILYSAAIFTVLTEVNRAGPIWVATALLIPTLLVFELIRWRAARGHAYLASAPLWTGDTGVRALVEGVVRDPTPVTLGKRAAALGRVTAYDKGIGSNPDTVKWARFHAAGTFLVDSPAGVVEVDPAELAWASTVVDAPKDPSFDYEVSELIPVGGKVAAVGWLEASSDGSPPRLRSKGTSPAYLLATSEHGDPRGLAWRIAWHRRLNLIALTGLGVTLAALALA